MERILFRLLFYTSIGSFISMGLLKPSEVGKRYFVIHGLIYLILLIPCFFLIHEKFLLSIIVLSFVVFSLFQDQGRKWVFLFLGAGISFSLRLIWLDTEKLSLQAPSGFSMFYFHLSHLLSMLVLGMTLNCMLVGHWYLTSPKMSISELKRLSIVLIILFLLRGIFSSFQVFFLLQGKVESEIYRFLFSQTAGLFILMRYCWGVIGPLVLGIMIYETARIRSTQSATGILYVAVVFVFVGEILSQYLSLFYGIPL